ncbi:MAG: hypothetical protein PHP53_23935 [Prolixibacteraceae bacterium]|nr:hypothetical protein [Prolixibacteraceae bacterium]
MTVAESEGLKQFSATGALPAFTSSTFKLLGDTSSFIEDVGGSLVQKFDKDFVPPKSVSNWFREAEDNTYYKPSDSYQNIQNEISKQTKDKDFVGSLLGFGKAIVDNPIDVVKSIPEMFAQSASHMIAMTAGGEIAAPLLAGKIAIAGNALKTATAIGDKVAVESATKALALLAKEKTALDITAGIVTTTPSYTRAIAEQKAIHQGMTPEEARHANLAQMETDPTMIAHGALSAAFNYADISILKAGFNQSVKLGADALGRSMPSVAKLLGQEVLSAGGAMVGEGIQEFAQAVNESYASTGSVDWNDAKTQGFMGSIGGLGFHGAGKLLGATVGVGESIKQAGYKLLTNPVESKATTETGGSAITKTPEEIDANIERLNKIVEEYSANPDNSPENIEQVKSEAKTRIEALTKQKELLTQPIEEAPVVEPVTEEQVASMPIEEIANSQEASKIKVDELISKPTSENDEFIMLNDWEKSAMSESDKTRLGSKNLFEKTTGKELNIDTKRDDSIFTVKDIYAGRFNPQADATIDTVSKDIHNDILGFKKMFETATKSQNRMGLEYTKNNMNRYMARMYNTEAKRVNVSGEAKEARLREYNNFVLAYKAMFGENPTGIAPAVRGKKEVMTTQAKELFIEAVKQTDVMVKDLFAKPNAKQETFQDVKPEAPVGQKSTNKVSESKSTPKETKSIIEPSTKRKSLLNNPVAHPESEEEIRANVNTSKPKGEPNGLQITKEKVSDSVFDNIESIPVEERESKTGILADNIEYVFKSLNIFKKSESFKPLGYLNIPVALHDESVPKETTEYFGKFMKLVSGVYTSFDVGVIAPSAFMDERFQEAIFMNTIAKLSSKEVVDDDDESGADLYSMVSTIGTSTIKSLGLSYADNVTFDDSQNAKTYIGLTGIETMRQLGVVKFVQRDGKTYVEKVKDIELPHRARQFLSAQLQLEPVLNTDRKDKTNITIDRAEMFEATQEQVKAVNKYEKVEYSINTDFISWLDDNGITDNDLLNIEGYENNVSQKDRLTALMEFAGYIKDETFNFTYKIGNNSRLYIMETVANIQTDKAFARNMVTFNKKVKVIDKNMQFYKQAVIFGVTGKLSQNIDSDFNDITEEINNLTDKQYLDYAKAHQGVHTLLAISDYKSYLENESNHKTGLYLEVDGKTNGFAFAVMQLYKDNKDMLAKVGVTTDIKDKVMDGYEEVSASIVNKFTGSVRGVTINRNLVKKSFTEFLYGSSSKNVIERIANRIIEAGKENKIDYDAKEKEQINILALMIDSELRIKYARLLPYIALVKKTYDIMYKNFQSKVKTEFYDKINEKTTLKEYNKIKSDFMRKYAPSISLFGDAVKNKIPLYKTVMTKVGVGKTVNQSITVTDKSGARNISLPFGSMDFMPDASNSKAAPVITHFLDALCASESSNDDSDTSLIHDAFIGTIEGLINDTSGKYNENFMEIGTGINVLDKLMEIIVGLGVDTNTAVTYEQIGGKKVSGSIQAIFDKLKYGDKHSVLGQVSNVNQMESATITKEYLDQLFSDPEAEFTEKIKEFDLSHNRDALLNVFDELKSMSTEETKETHLGYLRDLVAKISSHMAKITETEKINVFKAIGDSHGAYDKKTGNIDIAVGNFMTHNSLSTAEVFAHELLHKAFSYALDANVRYRNEANKLMNAVKKEMDAKGGFNLLLERDSKGNVAYLYNTKDEAIMAKKTYDYIFSSNHEFLAFFATNERFRDVVQGLDVSVEKHENESWFGKVYNFIADLIDKLIYKIDGQTVAERADKLLNDMYLTNKKFSSTAEQSVFNQYEQFFNSKLNAKAAEMLIKYSGELLRAVNKVGGKLVKTVDEVAFILTKKRISEMALIRSLANQIMHSTDKWENVLKISQQKNKYSQDSETISTGMTVAIRNTLAGSTINEREALKLSMVDTDMQALSGYTTAQMIDLVGKNEYRYSEMKKIRNKLLSMAKSREEQEYIYYVINQSEGLGVYMAENSARLRGNQYLNIENILKNAPASTKKVKLDASLVENLATLSAIEFTNEIVRLEAYQYAVANQQAVEDVIKMHGVVAKESKAKLFDAFGDSHYYIKGYTTELNSKTVDVVVRPLREKAQLEEQEYKFISKPESSSAIDGQYAQEQMGVFVRYNLVPKYTQGLLSIQDFAVKGTKLNELNFADRVNGDIITGSEKVVADMTRIQYAEQCKGIINFRSKAGHQLVPVLDPFGKIVNYRYTMSKENKRNILGQNHEIDKVLGNMNGDNYRKISSIAIDQEIIKEMLKMQHDAKDLSNFVPVTAYGKYQDFYRMIPKKTLEYLNSIKPKDEPLMVHKDLIETMFGYRNVTVQDIKFLQGKKAGRLLAWAERIWQDFVAHSREGITIKNPRVVGGNIISNTNTLITHGMSPEQAVLKQLEGAKLLDEYRALKTEWVGLDIQRKIGKKINETRFKELAKQIANSPLLPLLKKGQFQSIIDDVNLEKMDSTNIVELYGDAMLGKLPKEARRIIDEAYISKDTETFQKLLKVVQYSDFVAKYALYDFQTKKKGMASNIAMKLVSDMFVDYSLVQNKWVKYADDMSIFMFSKYLFRIQKAIARNLIENPIPMMTSMLAQRITFDISSIDDSSLFRRNPLNRLFMLNPLDELVPHTLDYVPFL